MISLVIGCCIIAFGAYLETVADVAMIPADALIRALVKVTKKEYGMVRMISDVTMTLSAAALCLIFLGELTGVREGSIIAAVLIGNIMRMYSKKLGRFADFLDFQEAAAAQEQPEESGFRQGRVPAVITIDREYGSGGRVIGRLVADSLGMKFYDSELIQMIAAESGYTEESVSEKEQKISNALLHDLYSQYTAALSEADLPQIERLFNAEKKVICQIASEDPCVIVGRLSNRILKDHPNALNIFISAAPDAKVRRVVKRDGLSEAQAAEKIKKVERERANYCKYFSKTSWNNVENYDMTFRSGIEETADMITEIVRRYSFG
ncbi:MAG: cytidylate kinase family protein [Anaerovoracaceae bacterium]